MRRLLLLQQALCAAVRMLLCGDHKATSRSFSLLRQGLSYLFSILRVAAYRISGGSVSTSGLAVGVVGL